MKFQPGDTVSVLDEAIEGKVVNVKGSLVSIVTSDGFAMDFDTSDLVKTGSMKPLQQIDHQTLSTALQEKEQVGKPGKSKKISKKERTAPAMEVDLHIHQLTNSTKRMDNYDMLTLQLDTAKRQLDFAISKRIQRVVFIHGVGEGVLRTELEFLLNRYDNIKFYDADYQKYGRGATEVYIFQNPK